MKTMKTKFSFLLMAVLVYVSMAFVCNGDGYYPHPDDCYKYIECLNGKAYVWDCPEGLAFNPELNLCDYEDNVGCHGITRYTEKVSCLCDDKTRGFKFVCSLGFDNTDAHCISNSPCYMGSGSPDAVCGGL